MPERNKDEEDKEYLALLAAFQYFVDSVSDGANQWEALEALMDLRAKFAISHAFRGFGLTFEEALELIRQQDGLTEKEAAQRDVLVAAVDNLVEFAVAEEYQMMSDLPDFTELEDSDDDEELLEDWFSIFDRYNKLYALVENQDAEYAMAIASVLATMASHTWLMYMTMGDERVRPWHLQYEGFTAPKSLFPAWLIPPIEHGCRCYLVEDTPSMGKLSDVQNATMRVPEIPEWFNPTFKESVALGGKIFSYDHPYFDIKDEDKPQLREIAERIKKNYM